MAEAMDYRIKSADMAEFMDVLRIELAVITGGSSGGFAVRRFAVDYLERTLGFVLQLGIR